MWCTGPLWPSSLWIIWSQRCYTDGPEGRTIMYWFMYEAEKEFHLFFQLLPRIDREIFFFVCSSKQLRVNTSEINYLNRNGLSLHSLFRRINCIWFMNCLIWGFFKKSRLSGKKYCFFLIYWVSPLVTGSKDIPTGNANERTVFSFSCSFIWL